MLKTCVALAFAALLPVAARAEPISVDVESSSGGFTQTGTTFGWFSIDLGTVSLPDADSTGVVSFDGLRHGSNFTLAFDFVNPSGLHTLRLEILDPTDGDDRYDPDDQPGYVPAGYSTSHDLDGFSFAQASALERSAMFAGGSGSVTADEGTHRGDILMFSGLSGGDVIRITLGLRDRIGGRGFLVRFSGEGIGGMATPEPASMLLIGTGLLGLGGAYRRRARATAQKSAA